MLVRESPSIVFKLTLRDPKHVSTSCAERLNLTMRMRRFTRLTNAFSKKVENHAHAIALHFFHNFIRRHQTHKTTPAVAAGVTERVWTIAGLIELLEHHEQLSN